MIFPSDSEIREYAAYEIRTRKIILELFKQEYGRDPSELEMPELLRAAIIPIGFLPKQNGQQKPMMDQSTNDKSKIGNAENTGHQEIKANQRTYQKPDDDNKGLASEIMRIIQDFPYNLEVQSPSKIKVINDLPRNEWEKVRKEFLEKGWKWDWKEKSFVTTEVKV